MIQGALLLQARMAQQARDALAMVVQHLREAKPAAACVAGVSHIDRSIIDTRRRQVEALFKEQALDR